MPPRRSPLRHRPPTRETTLHALLACPIVHTLGAAVPEPPIGRPPRHPAAMHLAWAALARAYRSGNRLDGEIAHTDLWDRFVDRYNTSARAHPDGRPVPDGVARLYADTHRHTRDRFCDDTNLELLCDEFTEQSVALAHDVGLLTADGMGSRTQPGSRCAIYGDGTVLRPIYSGDAGHRADPDTAEHHRHDGVIVGTKLAHFAVRGPEPHRRIVLAVAHVDDPGGEAATALRLVRNICDLTGDTVAAVIYDGALRGVHHNTIMTELGVPVINKSHGSRSGRPRTLTLGTWSHDTPAGPCDHTLVVHAGSVCDATLDDTGRAVRSEPCERVQIRRYTRPAGGYRFSLGVRVQCGAGDFVAWISPHPGPGDHNNTGRADQLRLIPPHEPLFDTLYGLRNDSEAINSNYKSTHVHDRAPVLGWRRQLFDLLVWSTLNNALAWWHYAEDSAELRRAA